MKQRVLLLDLGGVVFQSTGQSNAQIDWAVISQLNRKYGYRFNIGADVFPAFLKEYNQFTRQTLQGEQFLELVFDTLEFNLELIEALRKAYRIFIVSDNYKENITYISKRYQFSDWAEEQYYSFDFELEKANPDFFKRLLKEIDMKGEDLVFIDDSPKKLESAAQFGIRGIHFQDNKQVLEALGL